MRLFIAATYSHARDYDNVAKARYVLESYVYVHKWQEQYMSVWKQFFLDSGAFTMMERKSTADIDWTEYATGYANYVKDHQIKYFFELDLDRVIGLQETEKLRALIEKITGRQPIPVWHRTRTREYFLDMCRNYKYVAIGDIAGNMITQRDYKYLPWFIDTAHNYGCKIRGLGFTPNNVTKFQFDSVDSSSWLSGGRFGTVYELKGGRLVTHRKPAGKKTVHYSILNKHNWDVWLAWQKLLDKGYVENEK